MLRRSRFASGRASGAGENRRKPNAGDCERGGVRPLPERDDRTAESAGARREGPARRFAEAPDTGREEGSRGGRLTRDSSHSGAAPCEAPPPRRAWSGLSRRGRAEGPAFPRACATSLSDLGPTRASGSAARCVFGASVVGPRQAFGSNRHRSHLVGRRQRRRRPFPAPLVGRRTCRYLPLVALFKPT